MTCYLQLQQGGHLALNSGAGFLLLQVCDDPPSAVGGGKTPVPLPDVSPPRPPIKYAAQSYEISKNKYEIDRLNKLEAERKQVESDLAAKDAEIAAFEKRRAKLLANKAMQAEVLRMMMEAKALEDQRNLLMQSIAAFMREEEDILIILLSMPFAS